MGCLNYVITGPLLQERKVYLDFLNRLLHYVAYEYGRVILNDFFRI
jgi:hypothetical protein